MQADSERIAQLFALIVPVLEASHQLIASAFHAPERAKSQDVSAVEISFVPDKTS